MLASHLDSEKEWWPEMIREHIQSKFAAAGKLLESILYRFAVGAIHEPTIQALLKNMTESIFWSLHFSFSKYFTYGLGLWLLYISH